MDLIDRQAAIDTEGLDEQIRCEMCRNPMHTDRGCDGNCKYDEKLYERIMQILGERIKPLPSVQYDHIWNELSKVYNMDSVPDEAKSIIGDVMLGLGEQPEPTWHECFDEDPASFPDNERNVLVSFSNFSLSIIGQWRVDESGSGCWYLGDTDETFLSEDLYVDGWWELPKKPERRDK